MTRTESPDDLSRYAAKLAPHIDRLAICVHPLVGRLPEFHEALGTVRIPRPTILISHATLLASGGTTVEDGRLLARYREDPQALLDAHVEARLLAPDPDRAGGYLATPKSRELALLALRLQGRVARGLWEDQGQAVELAALADRHIDAARAQPREELPAFHRQLAVLPITRTPEHTLLARITVLRYLRADIHAAVLASYDLSGPVAAALHWLWRGVVLGEQAPSAEAPPDWAFDQLRSRGYAERASSSWSLTESGMRARETIEVATNERSGELAAPIPSEDRRRFLDGLTQLPGDDPRPLRSR